MGKKIFDLSNSSFVKIIKYAASRTGTEIVEISRWYPSSKICSAAGTSWKIFRCECANGAWQMLSTARITDKDRLLKLSNSGGNSAAVAKSKLASAAVQLHSRF